MMRRPNCASDISRPKLPRNGYRGWFPSNARMTVRASSGIGAGRGMAATS